ncbi:MAG: excinuclease ABC subunit UvrC [Candidatus Subteraquimicrobiales bacterium]|nr:excinuclease ABC subunit UvrC [Candidatus Subteraquimicrobiales bacterium]
MKETLLNKIKSLPDTPGVYIFKDSKGSVLYVGKASSLRERVSSYFKKTLSLTPKQRAMVSKVVDLDFLVVKKETEALLLESNLIKEHHPYYNVLLRDDKSYPYLAITLADPFPRAIVTRDLTIKGAKYYGPYTKTAALRLTLDALRKIFPSRACKGIKPGKSGGMPCLNYHINKCLAPCIGKVSQEEYRKIIDEICRFMGGRGESVIKNLEKEMAKAAKSLEFEKAALYRDKIKAAGHILEKQIVISTDKANRDVVGVCEADSEAYSKIIFVRHGKLIGSRGFILKQPVSEETLFSLLERYYSEVDDIPSEILLPFKISEKELLKKFLEEKKEHKVSIVTPKRGQKVSLLKLANENARQSYFFYKFKSKLLPQVQSEVLNDLKEKLNLTTVPFRIECFDISTLRGKESVGSMVVFEDGKPLKRDYRHFKIKRVAGMDDFAMMKEVINRRLVHLEEKDEKFGERPDLILVDGGKPQLSAAIQALEERRIRDIHLAALAKKEEVVFLPKKEEALYLARGSLALRLLQAIRDEAHRFALAYHDKLRRKALLNSSKIRKV